MNVLVLFWISLGLLFIFSIVVNIVDCDESVSCMIAFCTILYLIGVVGVLPFVIPPQTTMNGLGLLIFALLFLVLTSIAVVICYKLGEAIVESLAVGVHIGALACMLFIIFAFGIGVDDDGVVYTAPLAKLDPCSKGCPDTTYLQIVDEHTYLWTSSEQCPYPKEAHPSLKHIKENRKAFFECYELKAAPWLKRISNGWPQYGVRLYVPKDKIYEYWTDSYVEQKSREAIADQLM